MLLFLASQAATQARPLLASAAQECRCDERLCRCTHKHHQPVAPNCHLPGGTSLPTFQSCERDEQPTLASAAYLLPPPVSLFPAALREALIPAAALRLPIPFEDVTRPPPRTSLA
ncbi:MAG: hypothetical protein ACE5HB_00640 [Terriglobia bacterium]